MSGALHALHLLHTDDNCNVIGGVADARAYATQTHLAANLTPESELVFVGVRGSNPPLNLGKEQAAIKAGVRPADRAGGVSWTTAGGMTSWL
jgi:hypothetical protein